MSKHGQVVCPEAGNKVAAEGRSSCQNMARRCHEGGGTSLHVFGCVFNYTLHLHMVFSCWLFAGCDLATVRVAAFEDQAAAGGVCMATEPRRAGQRPRHASSGASGGVGQSKGRPAQEEELAAGAAEDFTGGPLIDPGLNVAGNELRGASN